MVGSGESSAPRPVAPPGDAPTTPAWAAPAATEDEGARSMFRSTLRPDWEHPFWGIPLGLLLVIGDALLFPAETGLTVGGKIVLCIALAMVTAATLWAWRLPVRGGFLVAGAVLAGAVAAGVSGDWFGGAATAPAWRDGVVPIADIAFFAIAAATWYAGRARGELLLVAAVTANGMVVYGQQEAPSWVSIAGIAVTLLFLLPRVGGFARTTGIVMHALALLGLAQQEPQWFTWTPYPFLTLIPVYLVAVHFRDTGRPRRVAWWTGVAVGSGTFLLGLSTLVGGIRRDLPLGDSWFMLGLGAGVAGLFLAFRFLPLGRAAPAMA